MLASVYSLHHFPSLIRKHVNNLLDVFDQLGMQYAISVSQYLRKQYPDSDKVIARLRAFYSQLETKIANPFHGDEDHTRDVNVFMFDAAPKFQTMEAVFTGLFFYPWPQDSFESWKSPSAKKVETLCTHIVFSFFYCFFSIINSSMLGIISIFGRLHFLLLILPVMVFKTKSHSNIGTWKKILMTIFLINIQKQYFYDFTFFCQRVLPQPVLGLSHHKRNLV